MALNTRLYNVTLNAAWDSGATALFAGGKVQLRTGTQPAAEAALTGTVVATLTLGSPALGAAVAGLVTANAITSDPSAVGGTIGYVAILKSDNTTVLATGSVGTSAANAVFPTLTITATNVVSLSSLTIAIPAQGA